MSGRDWFTRRERLYRKGMNVCGHHVADDFVDELVALERAEPGEALRDDQDSEMPAAIGGARMPRMTVAVVDHLQVIRAEALLETTGQPFAAVVAHGSTFTNGRISYDSNTPSVT